MSISATTTDRRLIIYTILIVNLIWFDNILDEAKLVLHSHYGSFPIRYLFKIGGLFWRIGRLCIVFFVLIVPAKLILVRKQGLIKFAEIQVWCYVFKHLLEVFELPFELSDILVHHF